MRILLFFLLFHSFVHAQSYTFNSMAKYTETNQKNSIEHIVYGNTADHQYMLKVIPKNQVYFAYLYDYKRNIFHTFEVDIAQSMDLNLKTKYLFTSPYDGIKTFANYDFRVESSTNLADDMQLINMGIYTDSKAKKPKSSLELTVQKNALNYFPLFKVAVHPFENLSAFRLVGNPKVVSAKRYSNGKKFADYELNHAQEVKFTIIIPEK